MVQLSRMGVCDDGSLGIQAPGEGCRHSGLGPPVTQWAQRPSILRVLSRRTSVDA